MTELARVVKDQRAAVEPDVHDVVRAPPGVSVAQQDQPPRHPRVNEKGATAVESESKILGTTSERNNPFPVQGAGELPAGGATHRPGAKEVNGNDPPSHKARTKAPHQAFDFGQLGHARRIARPAVQGHRQRRDGVGRRARRASLTNQSPGFILGSLTAGDMRVLQHSLGRRVLRAMAAVPILGLALPLLAQNGGSMKPLPDDWWHLSLDEIRSGENGPKSSDSDTAPASSQVSPPSPAPKLSLQEWAAQNQQRQKNSSANFDWLLLKKVTLRDYIASSPAGASSAPSAPSSTRADDSATSTESKRDTTLRDYTTATTRSLQQSEGGGTNVFRPLPATVSLPSLDFSLYNRAQTAQGASDKNAKDDAGGAASPSLTTALPGDSHYLVPSSPLDVVQSTVGKPALQSLPDPYANLMNPAAPSPSGTQTPGVKPADSASATPWAPATAPSQGSTTTAAGTKPSTLLSPALPQTSIVPVGGYSPNTPIPFAPATRRYGPNADGFYEPKSITDLQLGR